MFGVITPLITSLVVGCLMFGKAHASFKCSDFYKPMQIHAAQLLSLFAITVIPLVLINKTIKDQGFYTMKLYLRLTKEE